LARIVRGIYLDNPFSPGTTYRGKLKKLDCSLKSKMFTEL